jgi:6-pyruvoyltetrahydropterin/6-carboxytetrahydropterin synthase
MKVRIFHISHFNAAHRLHNPKWDEETNREVFGLCNSPNYHGHNYKLVLGVKGEIDPETGFVLDFKVLKKLVKEYIHDRFDHKNLNLDCEDFFDLNPTAENIAIVCWNILREKLDKKYELTVRLHETERNFVEYAG